MFQPLSMVMSWVQSYSKPAVSNFFQDQQKQVWIHDHYLLNVYDELVGKMLFI